MKQGREYDPDGEYVREYVSELGEATADEIHGWHDLERTERERTAPAYPAPIVERADRRERAIELFERARGRELTAESPVASSERPYHSATRR